MSSRFTRFAMVVMCVVIGSVSASIGGDLASSVTKEQFACASTNGWEYVIIRSYHSFGAPDTNAPIALAAAKEGGIVYRDVYHFPCLSVDPIQQVTDDVTAVGASNFGTLWFDIEVNPSPGCGWADHMTNCNFLQSMIQAGSSLGLTMGVYSSPYEWNIVMGNCTAGAEAGLPIWYAHYDDTKSFNDFTVFGGWHQPAMKQYNDADTVGAKCGISADADWYPN
jgi:hypothetical protein